MARKKLRPGVHYVSIRGQGRRKVRVLKNGRWRFMKGGGKKTGKGKKCPLRKGKGRSKSCTVSKAQAKGKARYVKVKGRYCRVR